MADLSLIKGDDLYRAAEYLKALTEGSAGPGRISVDANQAFMVGSGRLTAAVASNARTTLANPTGSGKVLYVTSLSITATVTVWGELRINPTTGLPAGARTPANKHIGGPASAAVMNADLSATTALGGGTLASTSIAVPANRREVITLDEPIRLDAGLTLGLGFTLGTAGDVTLNLTYLEETA